MFYIFTEFVRVKIVKRGVISVETSVEVEYEILRSHIEEFEKRASEGRHALHQDEGHILVIF